MLTFPLVSYSATDRGDTEPTRRLITHVCEIPFYCSSGSNSGFPGTWFPFFGLEIHTNIEYCQGYFFKPQNGDLIPLEIRGKISRTVGVSLPPARFGSLPGLLISSQLGGGLWDTMEGQELKAMLKIKYPSFYRNWRKAEFLASDQEFFQGQEELVNAWLLQQCKVENPHQLSNQLHRDWDVFGIEEKQEECVGIELVPAQFSALFLKRRNKDKPTHVGETEQDSVASLERLTACKL